MNNYKNTTKAKQHKQHKQQKHNINTLIKHKQTTRTQIQ